MTYRDLITFEQVGADYLKNNPKERSQLTLALEKVLKRVANALVTYRQDWNEEVEKLRGEYREKEKDGTFKERQVTVGDKINLLPVFLPEKEKELKDKVREIEQEWLNKEVPVERVKPHIVPPPAKLEIRYLEPFFGFVLAPMTEEEIDQHYLKQADLKDLK